MATFDVDVGGTTYEVDAPDERTAWKWANATHAKAQQPEPKQTQQRQPIPTPDFEIEASRTGGIYRNQFPDPDRFWRQGALTGRHGLEAFGAGVIADKLGLPQPQTGTERVAGDITRTMAGVGGVAGAASKLAGGVVNPIARSIMESLASNPGAQTASAIGSGAGGGLAREGGAGPLWQMGASFAGGLAAPAAIEWAKALGNKIGDIGATVGASFGNQRGIERIAKDAAQRVAGDSRQSQIDALRAGTEYVPGAKPTAAEAIAEANIGQPKQFGGATIKLQKDLSGAKGIEDILPSATRQQRAAIAEHIKNIKEQTAPMRSAALEQANAGGVRADGIIANIEKAMKVPGDEADDLVQKTLGSVKEKIASLADENGVVNAENLYTVRKKLGSTIGTFSRETANWDKKQTAKLERQIQLYIDDAIENAGGKGWKEYLSTYSAGMKGPEKQLAREREAKIIAAGVKGSHSGTLAAGELPHPPTLLSRPMMFANYLSRMVAGDANTPVSKYMAEQMRDPVAYARLLQGAKEGSPGISDAVRRAALAAAINQGQQP